MAAFCASRVAVPVVVAKGGIVSKQVRAVSGVVIIGRFILDKATSIVIASGDFPSACPAGTTRVRSRRSRFACFSSPRALQPPALTAPVNLSHPQSSQASAFHGVSVKSHSAKVRFTPPEVRVSVRWFGTGGGTTVRANQRVPRAPRHGVRHDPT
jgi:hypothetical protein